MNRPSTDGDGAYVTTPMAAAMIALMGPGIRHGSIAVTKDEFRRIQALYGYVPEQPSKKPLPPAPPAPGASYEQRRAHEAAIRAHAKWEDPRSFMQAGADRDIFRHAELDGLRLLAWIAKYVTPGEDPLKSLVHLACDAGWDVDPEDVSWAGQEELESDDAP